MRPIDLSLRIRKKALQLCHEKGASHLGGALSVADVLAVLYGEVANVNPKNPSDASRDRIFFSKGHACSAMYAVLQELGFYSGVEDKFAQNGSIFTSHVSHMVPGIELSTGSLGHALPIAAGTALAAKRKGERWKIYTILSDGELDEGSNWETILFAPHHALDNLVVIVDFNKIQSFGTVAEVLALEPLAKKFEAFRWRAIEIDGHDHAAISAALARAASASDGIPTAIVAHTIKGKGVSFMENKLAWHYKSPNADEYRAALAELEGV